MVQKKKIQTKKKQKIYNTVIAKRIIFYKNIYKKTFSIFSNEIYLLLFRIIILLNLISFVIPKYNKEFNIIRYLVALNQINIKINGTGTNNILNSTFIYKPDEILINNHASSLDDENKIYLESEENTITLKWNSQLGTCEKMFKGLSNIIEVDLSNFDSSQVTSMKEMFDGCNNLISINFNNFEISSVEYMDSLFYNCKLLTSLNLSSFRTSKTKSMNNLFNSCFSIKSLDLSNFDTSSVNSMFNMFSNCESLSTLDLSNFNTSSVTRMWAMFLGCKSLTSLNITSFKTSKVTYMYSMFYQCKLLTSLYISSFDTSSLGSTFYMFSECESLTSLNLSNFNTSKVTVMNNMFSGCKSLTSLDLSTFDTSKVESMSNMFFNCLSLISLNLSNFDIKNANDMRSLFRSAHSLVYIDLSNFKINANALMNNMFSNCKNLQYINFNNFQEGSNINITDIFSGVPNNISFCLSNEGNMPSIMAELNKKSCIINDCSKDWKIKQKKIISEKSICVYDCIEDNLYNYTFNNKCYNKCPEGPFKKYEECLSQCFAEELFTNICKIENRTIDSVELISNIISQDIVNGLLDSLLSNVLNDSKEDLLIENLNEKYLITSTSNQITYKNEETTINLNDCENILKEQYNINNEEDLIIYKIDYNIEGLPIPIVEYEIFNPISKEKLNLNFCQETKIYINIPVSIDEENIYKYEPNSKYYNNSCYPDNLEFENENILEERKREFNNSFSLCEANCIYKEYDIYIKNVICECNIKTSFNSLSEILDKKHINKLLYYIKNYEDEYLIYNLTLNKGESIDKIFDFYYQKLYNKKLNMDKDTIIEGENLIFQTTTSERQLNYINDNTYNNNISCIDLFECEEALKEEYNINEPLIIFKLDIKRNDTNSTQVEYQVFNPNTLERLNLSLCHQKQVNIYAPISLNPNILEMTKQLKEQGYDIFKSSDNFYNDICSKYTSLNGTDVILNDRRNDFYISNLTLCEEGCEYEEFNCETSKVKCRCDTKLEVKSEENVKFELNKIIKNFYKLENYANIKIVICYKLVFNLNYLKNNYGSYIIIFISLLFIIIMVINKNIAFNSIKNKNNTKIKEKRLSSLFNLNSNKNRKEKKSKANKNKINSNAISIYSNNTFNININKKTNKNKEEGDELLEQIVALIPKSERAKYFADDELNSLEYKYAIQIDFRTFFQYYYSLLRQTHIIIFTFFVRNDYNIFLTKLSLFLLSFGLYLFMNTLFFMDESLHQIYEDEGKYNFLYEVPQMIYSTFTSQIAAFLLEKLSLSQDAILSVKEHKNIKKMKKELQKIIKLVKIKLFIFFFVGIIFLFIFWYYLSAFCVVYNNTQGILLYNYLISYITGLLYPFLFNLFPTIFRIVALQKKIKFIYIFSDILTKIIGIL